MSATSDATVAINTRQRTICIVILALVMLFNTADRFVLSILVEPLKAEFGLSDTMLGLLIGPAFAILYATVGIPVARLADVGNRRTIIVWALGAWSAMTALCGMAQNFVQLFIFRVGVGIGEAGATPPSHSLIASYYPPEKRPFAFSFINMGGAIGTVLVYVVGSWVAQEYGWRVLLIAMGIPGIMLAFIARFLLVENRPSQPVPPILSIFSESVVAGKELFKIPAYRHLAATFTIYGFVSLGAFQWDIAFFMRSFELSLAQVSGIYGVAALAASLTGLFIGGLLGNYLSKRDISWLAKFPAIAVFCAFPFFLGKYMLPNFYMAIASMAIGSLLLIMFVGPFYAAVQAVSGDRNRGMAIALLIFLTNIIGFALGSFLTGLMSNLFVGIAGAHSLRYALTLVVLLLPWAGTHVFLASRHMSRRTVS